MIEGVQSVFFVDLFPVHWCNGNHPDAFPHCSLPTIIEYHPLGGSQTTSDESTPHLIPS